VTAKRPNLPPSWYQTLAATAAEFGTHPDRVLRYADAGLILPAALISKAVLPVPYPGPAPYLVVRLDAYREMPWIPDAGDMVAPLIGAHRAYQLDGHAYTNLNFDGAGVLVRRSELVITSDQIEELRFACEAGERTPHPAKLRTLQRITGALIAKRWPDSERRAEREGNYKIAEELACDLQLAGISLSKEAIALHVREARAERAAAVRQAQLSSSGKSLEQAA
jgi:hypothetical protein